MITPTTSPSFRITFTTGTDGTGPQLAEIRREVGTNAAEAADLLLHALRAFEALTPKRVVSSGEDILFYFDAPPRRAEIVCENDGTVVTVLSGKDAQPEVWSDTTSRLPETLARVRAHLL